MKKGPSFLNLDRIYTDLKYDYFDSILDIGRMIQN